ncbi:SDR family oxidoreductase [Marinifilum caeruleilacunae]|uniref:SDR family oxidoreductase n=1 Tax=Marinifilum caeruleilacunae TaxID=2499076 RepID=A0ABX1WZ81_9BACT|nr:SDR family NAD(P)-dependent oxidoreductase [Marinifilum caeruleilacunae]NOU61421.1 SDR family oxidoreductase [Marinifilum caeruleilacunae]
MRNVLITGAIKRLGKEVAEHMAAKGFSIALHYNSSKKEALELQAKLMDLYPTQKFKIFQCDLGNELELEQFTDKVMNFFDKLDVLINNASVFDPGIIRETDVKLYNLQMDVNLKAPFVLSRDFVLNNKKGIIVNFLDTRITGYSNSHAAYSISKVGLAHLTKMMALECGPNIRVNGIAPGATLPPEGKGDEYLKNLAEKTPMKIPGGVKPILQSLDYILDNENLTGQILYCDGGEQLL